MSHGCNFVEFSWKVKSQPKIGIKDCRFGVTNTMLPLQFLVHLYKVQRAIIVIMTSPGHWHHTLKFIVCDGQGAVRQAILHMDRSCFSGSKHLLPGTKASSKTYMLGSKGCEPLTIQPGTCSFMTNKISYGQRH